MKKLLLLITLLFSFPSFSAVQANQVKSFVYDWFTLFDQNAANEKFHKRLANDINMSFPDKKIRNLRQFDEWYAQVKKEIKDPRHDLKWIEVSSKEGSIQVDLEVLWTATKINGEKVSFLARQVWTLTEKNQSFQIKSYHVRASTGVKENAVKKSLQEGKSVFGGFVTIPHYKVIENLATSGELKFIWLEAEHSEFGPKEVQELTISAENEGLTPIVRVPSQDPDLLKKYLGTGVQGIIIPNIKTRKDAELAIEATKYPPLGKRPMGVERANKYLSLTENYTKDANEHLLVILMIENKEAIENIEDIVKTTGVDILHIGPFDLSLSMGVKMNDPKLLKAIEKVEKAAKKYSIPLGKHLNSFTDVEKERSKGYLFFTATGDMDLIRNGVRNYFKN